MTVADIKNAKIKAWIEECVKMCEPDNVGVCDGSKKEYDELMQKFTKTRHRPGPGIQKKKCNTIKSMMICVWE